MELLVLKSGEAYLRIVPDGYERVNMSKASVYPIDQKEKVEKICRTLQDQLNDVTIRKLIIIEEDY